MKLIKEAVYCLTCFYCNNKMLITVFNLPKTGLFIPGKVKLAKNMLCLTTFFHLYDHYFSKYFNLFVLRRKILAAHKKKLFIV